MILVNIFIIQAIILVYCQGLGLNCIILSAKSSS